MICFEHVSFAYTQGQPVLDDLNFVIRDGESVGLIGANGSGKSTLMKVLLGLLPHEGSVLVDEREVQKENLASIRKKLGLVLQNSDNQMFMPTVFEDMMFGLLNYGMSREDAERRTDEVLEKLGLTELKHRHNHRISGGEKRMAAIATVLAMDPDTMLMDEPTSALDPCNRRMVIDTIRELPNTKLVASHDLDMIMETCDRVILMDGHTIRADGSARDILTDEELLASCHLEMPYCLQRARWHS